MISTVDINPVLTDIFQIESLFIEKLLCCFKRPGSGLLMMVFAASLLSCGEHDHDEASHPPLI